jgi:hypothetical protein
MPGSRTSARGRRARDRLGGVIGVDDGQVVAVAHGGEHPQEIGRQQRIEALQHQAALPRLAR